MNDQSIGRDPTGGRRPPLPAGPSGFAHPPAFGHSHVPAPLDLGQTPNLGLGENRINLLGYWRVLVKRRTLVLGIAAAILAVGAVNTMLKPSIYRATATVQIDREAAKVVDTQGVEPVNTGDLQFYQTQYELLKSRSLAERVVVALDLPSDTAFMNRGAGASFTGLVFGAFRSLFAGNGEGGNGGNLEAAKKAAVGKVMGGLSIEPVRSSRLVRINYDSQDRGEAQRIANAFATQYVAANLDRRYDASSYARRFLEEHLQQTKDRLEESERALIQYAREEEIVNIDDRQSLVSARLNGMNTALTNAAGERIKFEQLATQAANTDGLGLPQILASDTISKLRERRAQLEADYRQKLLIMKPAFPEMVALKAQLDEVSRQIIASVEMVKESIRAQFEAAKEQEALLAEQVRAAKEEMLELQDRSIRYNTLKREVDTNRELYNGLLQRYKDVGVVGGVGTNNLSIVDRAEVPGARYSPSLSRDFLLYLVLGLFGGVGGAFLLEYIDDTFKSPEDVETALGLPVLGIIPMVKDAAANEAALEDPRSGVAEAYQSLRTALQFSTSDGMPKCLLITSPRPAEGKSTSAEMLARNFAQIGSKTLLIDADLRNPSLHRRLKREDTTGLSNYLAGAVVAAQLFQRTDHPNLTFVACGPLPPNPVELLAGTRLPTLISAAAEKFDVVIVDGPPVMGIADAPLLASVAHATLLVVAATETRQGVAKAAMKRLVHARAHVVGVALSKFDPSKTGYSYGYGYGGYGDYNYYGYGSENKPKLAGPEA